jgi:hypothetical protein
MTLPDDCTFHKFRTATRACKPSECIAKLRRRRRRLRVKSVDSVMFEMSPLILQ